MSEQHGGDIVRRRAKCASERIVTVRLFAKRAHTTKRWLPGVGLVCVAFSARLSAAVGTKRMTTNKPIQYNRLKDTLRGEIVYLRAPKRDEVPFVQALWADPETMQAVGGTCHLPTERFDPWFAHMVEPGNPATCYCLILKLDDTPVGEVSFHRWNPWEQSAVLNVKVQARYRGHGYGADALMTFLSWFFGPAGGHKMMDDVALENQNGQRLLRSLGFEQVSNRDPAHDCQAVDVCMLDITREMYQSKHRGPNPRVPYRVRPRGRGLTRAVT